MPAPSIPNSFSASTRAKASLVNENFTALLNAINDGTKDLTFNSINKTGGTPARGTNTNDAAATGFIGEFKSSSTGLSNVTTSDTTQNITSISLDPGDWDVMGNVAMIKNGCTLATNREFSGGISSNSATLEGDHGLERATGVFDPNADSDDGHWTGTLISRKSLATTTTVYLVCRATFSAGNPQNLGSIRARRIR